jgi:hypothetical protein
MTDMNRKANYIGDDIAERLGQSSSIVADIDKTYLINRMGNSALKHVKTKLKEDIPIGLYGLLNGIGILIGTPVLSVFKGSFYSEKEMLKRSYDILAKAGITEDENNKVLKDFITNPKNVISGAGDCLNELESFGVPKELFLSTTGPSDGARIIAECVDAIDFVSNPVKYDCKRITGIDIIMQIPEEKRDLTEKMLRRHNKKLEIVIDDTWGPLMKDASVSIAPPGSKKETCEKADIYISDYRKIIPALKGLKA